MEPVRVIRGVAAPMPVENIDTDMIIPRQYLKTTSKAGLGAAAFHDYRYTETGEENAEFVLNKRQFRNSNILVALDNFACGSAREHACWALKDFGFAAILAPSFSTFFQSNCYHNGLLPIVLPRAAILRALDICSGPEPAVLTIDIERLTVGITDGSHVGFDMPAYHRANFLNGRDEIDLTLEWQSEIARFEQWQRSEEYWRFSRTDSGAD